MDKITEKEESMSGKCLQNTVFPNKLKNWQTIALPSNGYKEQVIAFCESNLHEIIKQNTSVYFSHSTYAMLYDFLIVKWPCARQIFMEESSQAQELVAQPSENQKWNFVR